MQSVIENPNGFACVWIYSMGDNEEDIAMWEEASVCSCPPSSLPEEDDIDDETEDENDLPARGLVSIYSEQEVQQHVRTSVTSALERARMRHSLNLERRRLSSMSPSLNRGDRKKLVRQSMFSTLSLRDLNV